MEREVAIKIQGLKKMYKLGQIGGGTLHGDLTSWWARVRGKEDPNSKIGTDARSYGQTFMAINGIDLTIYKGEAIGIIGGNGAGKSTTLKILSRITAPTEGKVDIYGRIASMLEVGTGFNGELTGRENIYMNGAILGMSKAEVDAKMEEIIDFSECREFIDTPVKRYSSGMYVKLAFSVAAHLDSEIMIMDEVLAVGDMAFQKKCLNKMRDAATLEGRTVLYVSHNMNTIRQLCERCVVLDKGKIIFDGDVEEAISIYLQTGQAEYSGEVDLRKLAHTGMKGIKTAEMERFVFTDRETPMFKIGEKITANMHINVNNKTDDLCIRAMVYSVNETVVGMMTSKRGDIDFEKGKNILSLNFDISMLSPGQYYLKLVLYDVNEFGSMVNVDVVDKAVGFEIDEGNSENKITWESKWWGHICMPRINVN